MILKNVIILKILTKKKINANIDTQSIIDFVKHDYLYNNAKFLNKNINQILLECFKCYFTLKS